MAKKSKTAFFALMILLFSISVHSQNKIILRRNIKTIELEKGQKLMPLLADDTSSYSAWTSSCKTCSELPFDSIWEIDSISLNSIVLKRIASYRYDTISQGEFLKLITEQQNELYRRSTELTVRENEKHPDSSQMIFKVQDKFSYDTIDFTQLKALRFARNYICKKGDRRTQIMLAGIGAAGIAGIVVAQIVLIHPYPILILPVLGGVAMIKDSLTQLKYFKVKTYSLSEWTLSVKKPKNTIQ